MVSKFANIIYPHVLDLQVEIGKMREKFGEKFPFRRACPICNDDIGISLIAKTTNVNSRMSCQRQKIQAEK